MKKMTPTQATERLAAMIEPKPEPAGRMQILSHKLVWHWYPEIMTAMVRDTATGRPTTSTPYAT
jgi:hypothetical protein